MIHNQIATRLYFSRRGKAVVTKAQQQLPYLIEDLWFPLLEGSSQKCIHGFPSRAISPSVEEILLWPSKWKVHQGFGSDNECNSAARSVENLTRFASHQAFSSQPSSLDILANPPKSISETLSSLSQLSQTTAYSDHKTRSKNTWLDKTLSTHHISWTTLTLTEIPLIRRFQFRTRNNGETNWKISGPMRGGHKMVQDQ